MASVFDSESSLTCPTAKPGGKSCAGRSAASLADLAGMAECLGLGGLLIKDESYHFGLNAFKVLGGSFAIVRYIADETGKDVSECDFDYLASDQLERDFDHATVSALEGADTKR